jgi:hypothetical protein
MDPAGERAFSLNSQVALQMRFMSMELAHEAGDEHVALVSQKISD